MIRSVTKSSFIVGVCIGIFLAVLVKLRTHPTKKQVAEPPRLSKSFPYEAKLVRKRIPFDSLRYGKDRYLLESQYLHDRVTVLCVIIVKTPKNAEAAQNTWGKHCNQVHLLNITGDKRRIPLITKRSEESSWVVLCKKLRDVPEDYKWVLVVYDYTFALVENLRLFVAGLNPDDKYYLGHVVTFWGTVYNMGQAGYVLSRGVVSILKEKFKERDSCSRSLTYRNQEDYYLGKNLLSLNVTPVDTRDVDGLSTFHPYNLYHVFFPGDNYYKFSVYPHKCCSPFTIVFQSIEGDKMYTYYYLLYTLQLFYYGNLGNKPPFKPLKDDEIWKRFLKERNIPENVTSEQYYRIWENIVDDPTSFAKHMKREEHFDYV